MAQTDFTKFIDKINISRSGNDLDTIINTEDLVFFDSQRDILIYEKNRHDRIAYPTDYAIMNNVTVDPQIQGHLQNNPTNYWLTSAANPPFPGAAAHVISSNGAIAYNFVNISSGVRPGLGLNPAAVNAARESSADMFKLGVVKDKNGNELYHTIEFGEYPKTYVGEELNKELENAYYLQIIKPTSKTYTGRIESDGTVITHDEYEYKGEKYVRVLTKKSKDYTPEYSDGTKAPASGTYLWVKVEPITWKIQNWKYVSRKINPMADASAAHISVQTEDVICCLPFHINSKNIYSSMWQNSTIRGYLNGINVNNIQTNGNPKYGVPNGGDFTGKNNFLTEALIVADKTQIKAAQSSIEREDLPEGVKRTRLQKLNPDKMPSVQRRKMTDTEMIKAWIDAGQSVLLRGPSGIGKTERIKKLYPDAIYIKLTNNMFPEKVVGSMNLQTGQAIPPDFAKEAILQCATEEEKALVNENIQNLFDIADQIYERSKNSDKKVVILLDELLNVKPAVQSLVYTLVLNKLVETGKGLKLPANTVVVATGNQKKYSAVAQDLAEPLEKRFDHILDMEPKVGQWLYEYAIPNKLHPAVIGYIFSKYQENGRSEKTSKIGYFYEEPEVGEEHLDKNGCRGRTNDPRGWASISNTLYTFEEDLQAGKFVGKDVEHLLQTSINSKLREEWAQEFFNFYNNPTVTVEEVVSKRYTKADLPTNISAKFAVLAGLLSANETQVGPCRDFIKKYCDPEYVSVYDIYWTGNDEKRMEKIAELDGTSVSEVSQATASKAATVAVEEKFKFKIDLDEFWDEDTSKAIKVRNDEEELLIRKAFDKMGKCWRDGDSYLTIDGTTGKIGYFCSDEGYFSRNTSMTYSIQEIYNIEDVDLTKYLSGKDLEDFKEICEKQQNSDIDLYGLTL